MLIKTVLSLSGWIFLCIGFVSCRSPKEKKNIETPHKAQVSFAQLSTIPNAYQNFDSPKAINAIVRMENQYFESFEDSVSPFYGTLWRESLETDSFGKRQYERYRRLVEESADSMHCTIYAVKALKAGMGEDFAKLEKAHQQIWGKREHAAWSIGYLLVRDWGWKAYSIIDSNSKEFRQVQQSYKRTKTYPVWRQPEISLEAIYTIGKDDDMIRQLLAQHEFGWGFSDQGYHTWITRFDTLKECNWLGAPGKEFAYVGDLPLFLKTAFQSYQDYLSHVLIVPPLAVKKQSFQQLNKSINHEHENHIYQRLSFIFCPAGERSVC